MRIWIIILAFIASTVQAAPLNTFNTPTCIDDVRALPIYNLTAKASKTTDDDLSLYSSVVLIGKDLWRTTAHSVGYQMDGYIRINMPHKTITATVMLLDIASDVAYLRAPSDGLTPIPPLSGTLKQNQPVWNIGFPGIFDRRLVSYSGMYARHEKDGRITVSAMGWAGMSGGATVTCNGNILEMVGTITATRRSILSTKVWTDDKGVLNREKIYVNSGYSIIAPIKK
jgi:hypothetical protein